jgi:hypothetical protein
MNHQQFEFWLFADEPLQPDQEQALTAHLSSCASCRLLKSAWLDVEREFAVVQQVHQAPASGFVARWQARLAAEQAKSERRQGLAVLSFSSVATAVLLALLVAQWVLAYNTPAQFFLAAGVWFASAFSLFNASFEILTTMVRTLPVVFLVAGWVSFAGLGLLSTMWVVSIHQFAFKRRVLT